MLCMTVLKPLKPQFMHEFMGYLHAEIKTKFTKRAKGLHQRQAVLGLGSWVVRLSRGGPGL